MAGSPLRSSTRIFLFTSAFLIGAGWWLVRGSLIESREVAEHERHDADGSPTSKNDLDLESATDKLIEAHNRIRKAEKYSTFSASKKLQNAAELHAKDMADRSTMTHKGSDGTEVSDRVKTQKYDYRRVGENIASGRLTIEQVMEGWMKSESHRKNILGGFSQIGAAVVRDENGIPYWCVVFGLPRRK